MTTTTPTASAAIAIDTSGTYAATTTLTTTPTTLIQPRTTRMRQSMSAHADGGNRDCTRVLSSMTTNVSAHADTVHMTRNAAGSRVTSRSSVADTRAPATNTERRWSADRMKIVTAPPTSAPTAIAPE